MTGDTAAPISSDDSWRSLEQPWPPLFEWVQRTTGGKIVEWRRQARWRPAWYLTVDTDGRRRQLYVRCQREESMPWTGTLSLRREYRIMQVLHQHDVAVAAPLAFCEEPEAILMEAVHGRDRFDDRDDQQLRDTVVADYMRRLVQAHRLDTQPFEAIGLSRPADSVDIGYMGFGLSEKWYRQVKPAPDPTIEFVIAWLHRSAPRHRTEVSWIHFDAGQFLHAEGAVTALMDVEFACLGDPMADLGAMRMRDTAQPIGNLTHAFATYAHETGEPIDRAVVNFHAVRFALLTAMLSAGTRADPPAEFDLAQWQAWSLMALMICLEIIAEEGGYQLDPPPAVSFSSIRAEAMHRSVQRIVDDVLGDDNLDDHLAFRLRIVRDLLPGIHRAAQAGDQVEQADRDEASALLGTVPADWAVADGELERAIATGDPIPEADMVRLLARRIGRQIELIRPGMRDVRNFSVQAIDWSVVPTT
ncbi:phosphotransferase [Mycobacterium sp. C31M]